MWNIEFADPWFFLLLVLLAPMIYIYFFRPKKLDAFMRVSNIHAFQTIRKSPRIYLRHALFGLRCLAIVFIVIVLARPQLSNNWETRSKQGIDIVIALDISSSMLAMDFQPNRLEASKDVAMSFISGRPDDRIGLIVFSGESYTQCPLTTDHKVLLNLFHEIKTGIIEDGTAIGLGLANAINRLKDSKSKSKVIILLTDGVNNKGEVAPQSAAEMAKEFGIRVYTVGVGTMGTAPYPFETPFGPKIQDVKVEIDEPILTKIANLTNGEYYRATNNNALKEIYTKIDKLEKSKIEVNSFSTKNEFFEWFLGIALALFAIELILRFTFFRSIP